MAKFARLCGVLVLLTLTMGTIACQKQDIASTNPTQTANAQSTPYVDRREEIRNSKKAAIAQLDATIRQNPKDSEAYNLMQRERSRILTKQSSLSPTMRLPTEIAALPNCN